MKRKPYCPWNGCGMVNGAAPPVFVKCKQCNYGSDTKTFLLLNTDKVCPKCNHCLSCGRITKKKFYEK